MARKPVAVTSMQQVAELLQDLDAMDLKEKAEQRKKHLGMIMIEEGDGIPKEPMRRAVVPLSIAGESVGWLDELAKFYGTNRGRVVDHLIRFARAAMLKRKKQEADD